MKISTLGYRIYEINFSGKFWASSIEACGENIAKSNTYCSCNSFFRFLLNTRDFLKKCEGFEVFKSLISRSNFLVVTNFEILPYKEI